MIAAIMENEGMNIFESVLVIRAYFNMTEQEAYDKLNDDHKALIRNYAVKEYGLKA